VARGVLFDFGDTLFHRAGGHRLLVEAAADLGADVGDDAARRIWDGIQARARTPEEIAKGRDLSEEAHRRCWTALYSAADVIAPGMGERLYAAERDPARWAPYPDTVAVLRELAERGIPVGVVSDTGWDIRPVFERTGTAGYVSAYVLSCEHGAAKPARVLFETGCAALSTPAADTLMVGDNALTDGGAAACGLTAVILPPWSEGRRGLEQVLALAGDLRPGGA
jgi:FMN phosphatase YigB (HAD superfamily)